MEISHLTQSSAAPSLVVALTVILQCTLTSREVHMFSLQSGKEQYLTGDMWQRPYARDTLHVLVSRKAARAGGG